MNIKEINDELSKVLIEAKNNPKIIEKILIKSGICDVKGNLTEHYL